MDAIRRSDHLIAVEDYERKLPLLLSLNFSFCFISDVSQSYQVLTSIHVVLFLCTDSPLTWTRPISVSPLLADSEIESSATHLKGHCFLLI